MKENPFKRTFQLVQHTPLIHFQQEQAGATLRATEVKAKLDKYLILKLKEDNPDGYKKYLIQQGKSEHAALNYKLRIYNPPRFRMKEPIGSNDSYPMFLANMGSSDDYAKKPKGLVWYKELGIEIRSFFPQLLDFIETHLERFFLVHNFGMRSSKGYGSFTLSTYDVNTYGGYQFTVDSNNWLVVMRTIDLLYKSIRSGLNGAIHPSTERYINGIYMKPLVFMYALTDEVKWEKKIIKEQKLGSDMISDQRKHKDKVVVHKEWPLWNDERKERIVRDNLGLSTEQEWGTYSINGRKVKVQKEHATAEESAVAIERFPSPLFFKPIQTDQGYTVLVRGEAIPEAMRQAKFSILVNGESIGDYGVWDQFDTNKFMREYFVEKIFRSAVQYDEKDNRQREVVELLAQIYHQLNQ